MPYPGWLHPEPLPQQQFTADPYLCRRHSNTVLSQSLWGLRVLVYTRFEPSERLWRVWGLILNALSPLLPSCWGFSFALGCGAALERQLHWCWSDFEEIPHIQGQRSNYLHSKKVSFHSNPKKRQCQRMLKLPHNCTHLTR